MHAGDPVHRFVCTCRHARTRWVRGRGWWRWLLYGPITLSFGAVLHLLLLAVELSDVSPVVRVATLAVHVTVVVPTVVLFQRLGHRIGCTLRSLSYWLVAGPAWTVAAVSQLSLF